MLLASARSTDIFDTFSSLKKKKRKNVLIGSFLPFDVIKPKTRKEQSVPATVILTPERRQISFVSIWTCVAVDVAGITLKSVNANSYGHHFVDLAYTFSRGLRTPTAVASVRPTGSDLVTAVTTDIVLQITALFESISKLETQRKD